MVLKGLLLNPMPERTRLRVFSLLDLRIRSNIINNMIIADVFILPSTTESWGLIINEAMDFGLPIITTNQVGAAPDLVRHGENGFI